jgi:hypothetical protein
VLPETQRYLDRSRSLRGGRVALAQWWPVCERRRHGQPSREHGPAPTDLVTLLAERPGSYRDVGPGAVTSNRARGLARLGVDAAVIAAFDPRREGPVEFAEIGRSGVGPGVVDDEPIDLGSAVVGPGDEQREVGDERSVGDHDAGSGVRSGHRHDVVVRCQRFDGGSEFVEHEIGG